MTEQSLSDPVTIKLFLTTGRSSGIRTAEISNWSGIAVAGPKSDLASLLKRPELEGSGIYFLLGKSPDSDESEVYIGEADVLTKRLYHHRTRDNWIQAVVFTSKDRNLSKGHIRYLEGRLIRIATDAAHAKLLNAQASGSPLSESDEADMEVFLTRIRQLLPILGSDVLAASASSVPAGSPQRQFECRIKGLVATGIQAESGFVVLKDSQAVPYDRPSASGWLLKLRQQMMEREVLGKNDDHLVFLKDHEFSSPSAAASVIRGGNSNGQTCWKDKISGKTLKKLEELVGDDNS